MFPIDRIKIELCNEFVILSLYITRETGEKRRNIFVFQKRKKNSHERREDLINSYKSTYSKKWHYLIWLSSLQTLPHPKDQQFSIFTEIQTNGSNLPKCRIVRSAFSWFHVSANESDIVEQENSRRGRVIPSWPKVKSVLSRITIIRSTIVIPRTWWRGGEVKNPS